MNFYVNSLITDLNIKYRNLKKSYQVSSDKFPGFKSNPSAETLRVHGNELYKLGDDRQALDMYTKSVSFSSVESEELALAYSNRSAVLFRMQDYVSCLLDVNRALESNYPNRLKKKLLDRKRQCIAEIRSSPWKNRIKGDETNPIKVMNNQEEEEWRSVCKLDNPLIPKASSKIKLDYNKKWGRHLTATEDINIGEILSVEEFFVLCATEHGEYCSFCLSKCNAPIPCSGCFREMYCTEQCRTRADNSYHRTECKMLPFYLCEKEELLEMSISTAVRTMLIGTEQGIKLKSLMERLSIRNIFEDKNYVADEPYVYDYLSIIKLSDKLEPSSLKSKVDIAVKTLIMLKRLSFFGNGNSCRNDLWPDYLSEEELFVAALIINHLCSLKLEAFGVNLLQMCLNYSYGASDKAIGGGICSLQHLLSHSCNSNSRFFTRNREHVLHASQPIQQGERITTARGALYSLLPLQERAEKLASIFGITCDCEACANNWPIAPDLTERKIEFRTEDKNTAISNLLTFANKMVRKGTKHVRNADIVKSIIEFLGMLHKYVKQPSMHIVFCEDFFNKFMIMTFSEYGRESARTARNEKYVEWMFETMRDSLIHNCKKAKLIDYAVFPHLRNVNPKTYTMFRNEYEMFL